VSVFTSAVLQGLNGIELLNYKEIKDPIRAEILSHTVGASNLVMQRTLYRLTKAGIITVKRGPGGGFRITEEQLRTKRVLDVLEALGQPCVAPEGSRASDRIQQRLYDACDVTLEEFFG
jgi:DNA-binding IscR family transcriptional regulator